MSYQERNMEGKCIVSSCGKAALKCCGSCGLVRYCSIECQKEDWKKHHKKLECVNMKKLSSVLLTEEEIDAVADKIIKISDRLLANGEHVRNIDLLKECICFIKDRFGSLDCKDFHSMIGDGVELNYIAMSLLLFRLGHTYYSMPSSSETDNHAISYLSEARELLVQKKDAGKGDMVTWELLFCCEKYLCPLYRQIGQLEKSKYHCVEFVASARQYEGPNKADYMMAALTFLSTSLQLESEFPKALAVAEEAYLIASKHYSPAHKMVLEASREMIWCLIKMKDFSTADTYCRMNYANVFAPINAGEYGAVDRVFTMRQLVNIWLKKEPDENEIVEKALADEAIDLSRKAYVLEKESYHRRINLASLDILCQVLLKANQLTEETEGLLHQVVRNCTAIVYFSGHHSLRSVGNLCAFYSKLQKSLPIGQESTLVQENIELCEKKLLELKSCCNDGIGYINGSLKIKPYFKNNAELCI